MELYPLLMGDSRFDNMPIILETPDETLWAEEIKLLRAMEEKQ
jgi:deoxyribonuclease-4